MARTEIKLSNYSQPLSKVIRVESDVVMDSVSIEIGTKLEDFDNDETDPFEPKPATLNIPEGFALSVLEFASEEESNDVWE